MNEYNTFVKRFNWFIDKTEMVVKAKFLRDIGILLLLLKRFLLVCLCIVTTCELLPAFLHVDPSLIYS